MSDTIICPNCDFNIEVAEVLSAKLCSHLQKEFEADIRKKEAAISQREQEVAKAKEELTKANENLDQQVAELLAKERKQLGASLPAIEQLRAPTLVGPVQTASQNDDSDTTVRAHT